MSQNDDNAKATKGDIRSVRQEMRALKTEIVEELKRHFDVTVETIRHDLLGANKDDIEVLKDRVTRLEDHTGLIRR
ncbi:hypothetical protein HYZ99_00415 [Candidatus Peregrinibacteria bacterium]|nr:hypothetical protein [Candidatus Peregrinibacteria bacterium]